MLKTILRILCILAVAGIVCGAVYLLVTRSGISLGGLHEGREGFQPGQGSGLRRGGMHPEEGALRERSFRGEGHNEGSSSLGQGLAGIAAQAAKVALITLVVAGIPGLVRKTFSKKTSSPG